MKTFEYRGFDQDGYSRKGLVEGLDAKDARERLAKSGIWTERLVPAGHAGLRSRIVRRDPFPPGVRSALYRELAALLGAGVPLVKALDVLIESPESGGARTVLAGIRDRVREGSSLADAMSDAGKTVRGFERAVVAVGEKSATLDLVLSGMASFLEEQQRLGEHIRSALTYPSIVLFFALSVAVVMLGFVVPSTARLLEDANIVLPLLTRAVMKVGRVALWFAPMLLVLTAAGCAHVRHRLRSDSAFRAAFDRRLFHLPVIGRGYAILVNLRFARTLAVLLRGGVAILESLSLAGKATGSAWVEHRLRAESDSVRHGSSVADAVRRVGPLSASLPGWIQTGEASGSLDRLLDQAADRYEHQWNRFVGRCLSFLEPALILFVGAVVLLVALSILLPLLSFNRAIV